ncbi:MAG: hypothetical protein CMF99_02935 [Candidatus Marinimicrobia bacterium]|nr:hypothetical protein [Candidatus Neomarinimicrobiota bacterium]|tara:strand:+ start:3134 stop:3385 length:252 start_codon:yes stop_codon:yes gene_type:complete
MNFGQWLKSLSTTDHIVLIVLYIFSIYLSKISLESLIEMYDKQKKYSEFRIQFRITPIMLLSLGFLYSLLFYTLLEGIFDIMP